MDRFEFQLAMLQKGAEELEKKIANFTTILLIKNCGNYHLGSVDWLGFYKQNRCVGSPRIRYNFWFLVFRSDLLEGAILSHTKSRCSYPILE